MESRTIFIVGLPACGKSTFGRALAHRLGREFLDLDHYIENRFHTTVRELFAERGEEAFRALETAMLREAGEFENVVIATGGGAPCHSGNMAFMQQRGITLWLQASLPRICSRILLKPQKRPLLACLEGEALALKVEQLAAVRNPFYAEADICFATDELENGRQIAESVSRFLELFPELAQ